jgi:hypothetical protein
MTDDQSTASWFHQSLARLRRAGLDEQQCGRLIDLREEIRQGLYPKARSAFNLLQVRRLRFVRWLVRHGAYSEGLNPPSTNALSRQHPLETHHDELG